MIKFIDAVLASTYKNATAYEEQKDVYLPEFPEPRRSKKARQMEQYVQQKKAAMKTPSETAMNTHRPPPKKFQSLALNPKEFPPIRPEQENKRNTPNAWKLCQQKIRIKNRRKSTSKTKKIKTTKRNHKKK